MYTNNIIAQFDETARTYGRMKLADIMDSMADSVCITGFDDKITMVNNAMVDLFQVSREKLLTLTGFDLATKEDIPKILKAMQNLFKTGLPQNVEVTGRLGGAKDKLFWMKFSLLKNEKGEPIGIITVARDISESKKAEKLLNKTMEELALVNEKLGVVGRLTRHDVRNKLSAISGNIYLAKKSLSHDSKIVKYLNEAESAVDQIDHIFDFARTYEQLGVEELSFVDVGKCFDDAVSLVSSQKEVDFVNECKGLMVLADSLLSQLIFTIIDNSLKHGEKVSRIRIYYEVGEELLKIFIEDDGVGIPKEEKEIIFKEGYGKGTGLGLYLVKLICEVYKWAIQETGRQGKGAQFTITVPNKTQK